MKFYEAWNCLTPFGKSVVCYIFGIAVAVGAGIAWYASGRGR